MNEETILIADDSKLICDHFSKLLSNLGFTNIIKVHDGNQAIIACKEKSISLAFIDISMPNMDGLEALLQIRKTTPEIYIVMISGAGTSKNVKTSISYGAKGFIVKPCSTQKIQEAVDNYHAYKKLKN